MRAYIDFNPTSLLGPDIRHLSSFLILVICLIFFFSADKIIKEKGFQIPESLIDAALKLTGSGQGSSQQSASTNQFIDVSLSEEQVKLLEENPDLLKQYGLNPEMLKGLSGNIEQISNTTQNLSNNLIKKTINDQIENFTKPYLNIIPFILTLILFLTLQSLTSMINILIYPLLWITFFALEKSGFITFTTEMRPVKKMVI